MTDQALAQELRDAGFVKGIRGTDTVLDDPTRSHVAFIGRSNVGKSSVINAILGRTNLVLSSARPGKTTEINFFTVGEKFYFVDLPGYGFARMGEKQREKLRKLILWYLLYAEVKKRQTFIVLDAQVGLTDFDRELLAQLQQEEEQVSLIINKIDKLNQKEKHKLEQALAEEQKGVSCYFVSARNKRGIDKVREKIIATIHQ